MDALLRNDTPMVQVRRRSNGEVFTEQHLYDSGDLSHLLNKQTPTAADTLAEDLFDETPALGGQYGNAAILSQNGSSGDRGGSVDDPFMWAQRLQDLTDGEALAQLSRRNGGDVYGGLRKGKERSGSSKKRDSFKTRSR